MSRECTKCRGTGKCPVCGGSGKFNERIISTGNFYREKDLCPFCRGSQDCSNCRGTGFLGLDSKTVYPPRLSPG